MSFQLNNQSLPCQSNNMQQAQQRRPLIHDRSESVGFAHVQSCIIVHLAVWLQRET